MSVAKIYKCYVYLAGILIPHIDFTISSQYGQISSLQLNIPYSPYITHIFPFTKVQVFEQVFHNDTTTSDPTLEFDGVVGSISRHKNLTGQVSITLNCYTDGFIWDRRKQYDFYISEMAGTTPAVGTGDTFNLRADAIIHNYFSDVIKKNNFDVGLAAASILTCHTDQQKSGDEVKGYSYNFIYNGHKYIRKPSDISAGDLEESTKPFYNKYLKTYNLENKVYGISTSISIQKYFQTAQFIQMISNNMQDLHGENSFFAIAQQILNFGFYQLFDITNPCFIEAKGRDEDVILDDMTSSGDSNSPDQLSDEDIARNVGVITVASTRQFSGLAESVCKPISILGIPLKRNIIWPDQVISETLNYDFMNMPTRVIAHRQPWFAAADSSTSLLTTTTIAGPIFDITKNKVPRQYFQSLVPGKIVNEPGVLRNDKIYSDYEDAYGIKYAQIDLSNAFDETLLQKTFKKETGVEKQGTTAPEQTVETQKTKELGEKFNNFMNYEYSVKYFGARQYNVQVTPDTNPVIGLPIIIMDMHGQHIVAFVVAISKYYSALGQKNINLGIQYPRYYYENVGALGNLVDPTSADPDSMKEMGIIYGSEPLISIEPNNKIDSCTRLKEKIDLIFQEYIKDRSDNKDLIKSQYQTKKICTLNQFLKLHAVSSKDTIPKNLGLFASDSNEDALSTNYFSVYDHNITAQNYKATPKTVYFYPDNINSPGLPNQSIIQYHLTWCKYDQRI